MKIPNSIQQQILKRYQLNRWLLLTLDAQHQVTDFQGDVEIFSRPILLGESVKQQIPALETETFDENFALPFYHLNEQQVVDLHYFKNDEGRFLLLVPQNDLHRQTQLKQQIALDSQFRTSSLKFLLSELQKSKQKLQQANEEKAFFISALSHEMGTPINSIKGYVDLALQREVASEKALKVILKSAEQMEKIVKQTIDYDRRPAQNETQSFCLQTLLAELFKSLKPLADSKSLTFEVDCPQSIIINSESSKWQQILTNLVSNAIKYTEQGGVKVSVQNEGRQLRIDVLDSGIGIDPKFQDKLFKPWQRELKSTETGSGIGLVIARMLAEQLDIEMRLVKSDQDGSCFRLWYQLDSEQYQRILLIEDDHDLNQLFSLYLQQAGHQVTAATGMTKAQKLWKKQPFDLLITDLHLQKERADSHIDSLKKLGIPLFVLTGNPSQETTERLIEMGFDKVLSKPISRERLIKSVAQN